MDNKTFVDKLSSGSGIDNDSITNLLNAFGEILVDSSANGDAVVLPGLGTFETKKRLERVVVHPSSGKKLLVPPKLTLNFKPATGLKQKIR